jgi:hypothetical protein
LHSPATTPFSNGNHGTSYQTQPAPGKMGMGIELGANACVLVPESPSLQLADAQALTMMAWARVTASWQHVALTWDGSNVSDYSAPDEPLRLRRPWLLARGRDLFARASAAEPGPGALDRMTSTTSSD